MSRGTVIQVLPDFALAGAERMAEHLSIELAHRGWNVVAVSLFDERTAITTELESNGIRVVGLGKKPGLDISMVSKLRHLIKEEGPAAVHTHRYCMQYVAPATIGLGVRRVHTVHNMAPKEVPPRIQAIQKIAFSTGYAVPVAINQSVLDSICKLYGLDAGRVPLIHNGVPPYTPSSVDALPGDSDCFTFLTIGRAMRQKNQIALVRAFARLHSRFERVKLLIIGDGELRNSLASEISLQGAESYIFQLGLLPNARDYCYAVDAFVLPSLYEGMPMTLIEAMMAGLPVLASARGGSVDLVKDGATGYLCDITEDSILDGLERVILDQNRVELAVAGQKFSMRFTVSQMTTGYERLYTQ